MEGENESKMSVIETWMRKHRLLYVQAPFYPEHSRWHCSSLFFQTLAENVNYKRNLTHDVSSINLRLHIIFSGTSPVAVDFAGDIWAAIPKEQDYIFVLAFESFLESLLLKAQKETDTSRDVEVISGGVASIKDEIAWFKREASKWGVSLNNVVPQKANLDYCRFLDTLAGSEVEYPVVLAAFWAIETVYQDSFAHCLEDGSKTPEELRETCQRWGNDEFGQYCRSLYSVAEHQLENAPDDVVTKAELAILDVLHHEVEFWNMSQGAT